MSAIGLYVKSPSVGNRILVISFCTNGPSTELLDCLQVLVAGLLTLAIGTEFAEEGFNLVRVDLCDSRESTFGNDPVQSRNGLLDLLLSDIPILQPLRVGRGLP